MEMFCLFPSKALNQAPFGNSEAFLFVSVWSNTLEFVEPSFGLWWLLVLKKRSNSLWEEGRKFNIVYIHTSVLATASVFLKLHMNAAKVCFHYHHLNVSAFLQELGKVKSYEHRVLPVICNGGSFIPCCILMIIIIIHDYNISNK